MKTEDSQVVATPVMESLVWNECGRLELSQIEEPVCTKPNDVKVRIHMTGICGTDLAVITGKEPGVNGVIRGHEAVGTVVEVGEGVKQLAVGDRVVIDPNYSCGECKFCVKGKRHLCEGNDGQGMKIAGINVHGTFAPYFVLDESFVHKLSDSMSWEAAVLVEPLACVIHNFRVAQVSKEDRVLILGSGPMGLLCQIVSRQLGCLTVATEKNPYRLSLAKQYSHGAYTPEELQAGQAAGLVEDGKFDVVIDTVGNQMAAAEEWVERGGRIIPFGINSSYQFTITPTHYTQRAVQIIGAGEYLDTFETALKFAQENPSIAGLVTKKYQLSEYETAIHELLGYHLETREPLATESLKTVFVF